MILCVILCVVSLFILVFSLLTLSKKQDEIANKLLESFIERGIFK